MQHLNNTKQDTYREYVREILDLKTYFSQTEELAQCSKCLQPGINLVAREPTFLFAPQAVGTHVYTYAFRQTFIHIQSK